MLLLGTTAFSLPTFAQQQSMGMMGGGGHMGMMGKYKGLGLSDEQKQQMSDIQHKLRKKHWEIMGQMIDQQAALQKAHAGEPVSSHHGHRVKHGRR